MVYWYVDMIKWSIKLFTGYSLSPPVRDFFQLLASPISRTCREWAAPTSADLFEEHKMYVPEMVVGPNSWTLMNPERSWFREIECILNSELHIWLLKLNHICKYEALMVSKLHQGFWPLAHQRQLWWRWQQGLFLRRFQDDLARFTEICPGHRWAKWLWSETH